MSFDPVTFDPISQDEADFARVFLGALTTYRAKNHDYGDAWKRLGLRGVFVRWYDKTQRLLQIVWRQHKAVVKTESARDTLSDALLYNVMAIVLYDREAWDGSEP